MDRINNCIRDLDQASLAAISQNLEPRNDATLQAFQDQLLTSARELLDTIDPLRSAAKGVAEKLGHLVSDSVVQ